MIWPIVAVVALQVVVFQLAYRRLAQALPGILVGVVDLPPDVAKELLRFRGNAGRWRVGIGAALLSVLASVVAMGADAATVKLTAAAVSLASSFLLVGGYVHDRRVVARLGARVPVPSVRSAAVTRPELRDLYPPRWEAAVLVVWLVCMVPVIRGFMVSPRWPWFLWLGLAQLLVAAGGLVFSARYAGVGARLPQRARARLGAALGSEIDRSLRRAELRALLASRIGILLLLGLNAARATASGGTERLLDSATWAVVAALLVVFGAYLFAATRTAGRADIDSRSDPAGGAAGSLTPSGGADAQR